MKFRFWSSRNFAAAMFLLGGTGAAHAQAVAPVPPPVPAAAAVPLTLAAATQAAFGANALSRSAREQVTQATARLAQAQAGQRYQVTFSSTVGGSNARIIQPPPERETFGTLVNTLTVPLPLGRRGHLAVEQATQLLAAAQAQNDAARLSLAGQVSAAYYDLLRKQALLLVAQDNQATAQQQKNQAEKRLRAGDVAELDVLRTEIPVIAAESATFQAQTTVETAQQALNGVLGRPLEDKVTTAEIAPPSTMPFTLEEARTMALRNSPEVRAADATVKAQEIARTSAGLFREPLYQVQASDTRSNDQTSFSRLDSVQATITIPLSDGGLGRAQIREAQSALALAQAQAETARRNALVTVSGAYLTAAGSLRQIAATNAARTIVQTVYDKTLRGYQSGLFPLTDVLTAQTALNQARIAQTQVLYDAALANTTLQNATGNLPQ